MRKKLDGLVIKCCATCEHSMEHDQIDLLYCIAHPPTPVATAEGVMAHFPTMLRHGKCDEYEPGKPQLLGRTKV